MPFYVELGAGEGGVSALSVFRVIRLIRVFRVFKMGKSSQGIMLMATTLAHSAKVLYVLVFTIFIAMVVFSSGVYYCESGDPDSPQAENFLSIPRTFWWCLVTMCTVGYGDAYPVTAAGRTIAVFTMFLGVLIIALPVTVIGSSFSNKHDMQVFEARVERECCVKEGPESNMDLEKLADFLADMDVRGNLRIPLPKTKNELQEVLNLYDVRTNGKLDKGEWKAMIEDLVAEPHEFLEMTVKKIARELGSQRKQMDQVQAAMEAERERNEERHAELCALLQGRPYVRQSPHKGNPTDDSMAC